MANPSEELLKIAASYSPKIRRAIIESYREFLGEVSDARIASILRSEGVPGLLALADELGGTIAENVTPLLTDAWRDTGRKASTVLPKGAIVAPFSFDTLRVSAFEASGAYRAAFVTYITEKQRQAINSAIERSIMEGQTVAQLSRAIRGSIGLTVEQERWVENYRRQLLSMDAAALERALRDRRSDGLYQRLIDSGDMLTSDQIDSMVERYRQRMVKYRAETIARTEAYGAVQMGEYETILAADMQGSLSPLLRRFWVDSADERVRVYHAPIASMNPEGVAVNEVFQTPLGPMRYPLDPLGSARNRVNCRCHVEYEMPDVLGNYENKGTRSRMLPELEDLPFEY